MVQLEANKHPIYCLYNLGCYVIGALIHTSHRTGYTVVNCCELSAIILLTVLPAMMTFSGDFDVLNSSSWHKFVLIMVDLRDYPLVGWFEFYCVADKLLDVHRKSTEIQ